MDIAPHKNTNRVSGKSSLAQLFFPHSQSSKAALVIKGVTWTYAELAEQVIKIASCFKKHKVKRVGILASRSLEAYVGILGAHWIGALYVPLNPAHPITRLKEIISQAELDAILIDESTASLLNDLAVSLPIFTLNLVSTESEVKSPVEPKTHDLAYLIFTSGTTGKPKGVPISFNNLSAFFKAIKNRYLLTHQDKISQFSSLSFDVSIFDMALAWEAGATLYVLPEEIRLAPLKFIQENQLTVWLAVPSVIALMQKLAMLKPNIFPLLKYSLFTGEALTVSQAKTWQIAAPNSQLENLYGPTEGTIDCLGYVFHDKNAQSDYVPIGKPFSGMHAALVNEEHQFLLPGQKGELVIAGKQVVTGYWKDKKQSKQKFIALEHPKWGQLLWYFTGDYCYQDENEIFHYLYRLDNQCKILGHRIELEEIEYHLRDITHLNEVAVVFLASKKKIISIITQPIEHFPLIRHQLKQRLPDYMQPDEIIFMESLPYNLNGKLDRHLLTEIVNKIS